MFINPFYLILIFILVITSIGVVYYTSYSSSFNVTNQFITTTTQTIITKTSTSTITTEPTIPPTTTTLPTTTTTTIVPTITTIPLTTTISTTTTLVCSDGTSYGECSITKPKYCDNGNLIDRCSICGCPSDYMCQDYGGCIFVDDFTIYNTSRWTNEGIIPIAKNDELLFNLTGTSQINTRIRSTRKFGYGTYTVRFRTSGPRMDNMNYFLFSFYAPNGTLRPGHNEISGFEIVGNHTPSHGYPENYIDVSTYVDGVHCGYFCAPQGNNVSIDFEDKNYHLWEMVYQPNLIQFSIDGEVYSVVTNSSNIPSPGMYFFMGAIGSPEKTWTLYIDRFTFSSYS